MATARRILIVDDDAELRDALVEQLSLHEEFEAVSAETGAKGVQAAKGGPVDLVIMDVGLPDIDGREAVRILRKNAFKAPIIMLTGHDTDSDTILGLESGANDYVAKPFRFAVLLARIRAQLRQHEASEDAVFAIGPYSLFVPAQLEAADRRQRPEDQADRKGDGHPSLPVSRRPTVDLAGSAAAGGMGVQFRRYHAHAGDPHLPAAPEDRKGRRHARDPRHRGGRVQARPVRGSRHSRPAGRVSEA
jgi:CheY-like chemotaxis protein